MTKNNTSRRSKSKSDKKQRKIVSTVFKFLLVTILMVGFIAVGATAGLVIAIAKDSPEIDPSRIISSLSESSKILDSNGNLIERIHTEEYRTVVPLDRIPVHVRNAFIAIEDERFRSHKGVDLKRIGGALYADIKAGAPIQGASTITQQLVKNMYLLEEVDRDNLINDISRKIKEAYLAVQIERELTKDQILEAYINKIPLGQGAYGVQAAAKTYFSKDVSELTIAEAAMIAGITKNPSKYSLFRTISPNNVDESKHDVISEISIDGTRWVIIYNNSESVINRKNTVLSKMRELNYITEAEYLEAREVDIKSVLNPQKKEEENITSYFGDYVREQVLDALENELGYSKEKAQSLLFTGGLNIYSTIDTDLQRRIEGVFNNFDQILQPINGNISPRLIDETSIKNGNIVDKYETIIFYKKENILDENSNLKIGKGAYSFSDDGKLIITSRKINSRNKDIIDYYTINENKVLVTYKLGNLNLTNNDYIVGDKRELIINANFLNANKDFYTIDENNNLIINSGYFTHYTKGIIQPQAAVVITDYKTGELKALIGGRDVKDRRVLNRATNSQRQPGSSIKPISVYLPALDSGMFTAASIIDDIMHFDEKSGTRWPKNWYENSIYYNYAYRGLTTLRKSVEQSVNVNAVKVLEQIGIGTSLEYLDKMGLSDDIVTKDENKRYNDEIPAALALGGLTKGITPLNLTAAYGTIANQGIYVEPIAFTKIVDSEGTILYENKPTKHRVVDPQVAYLMTDILESTVSSGLGRRAMFDGAKNTSIPAAGKTGTTQNKGDAWFVGFTPYYASGVWIGNDTYQIKLSSGSSIAAEFWSAIMEEAHKGLDPKGFDVPDGFVEREICTVCGKLATDLCKRDPRGSKVRKEIFIRGTQPTEFCDVHVELEIDTSTGKLANEYCPPELVEKKVFIKRDLPYDPEDPVLQEMQLQLLQQLKQELEREVNKIITIPEDYLYRAPTEVCDEHVEEVNDEDEGFTDWLGDWIFGNNNNENQEDENMQDETNSQQDNENQENSGNQEDSEVEVIDSIDENANTENESNNE